MGDQHNFTKIVRWVPVLVGIFFLCLYVATMPTTNVSYADSDLMTTIGYFGGVAHPPGYPLYMLLVYGFTHLPFGGSVAFRAHLLSAFLSSVTLAVLFQTLWETARTRFGRFLGGWMAGLATFGLGTSFLYWTYSIVAEKYALNNLFVVLLLYCLLHLIRDKSASSRWWYLWGGVSALGFIGHHQTIILVIILGLPFLAGDLRRHRLVWWKLGLSIATGAFVSLLLLGWLNSRVVPVSWRFSPTLEGLVSELTRRDLTGTMVISGKTRGMYVLSMSVSSLTQGLSEACRLLFDYFGAPMVVGMIFGVWMAMRNRDRWERVLLIGFGITTLAVPAYLGWPEGLSEQSILVRQYLLGYMFVPFVFLIGLMAVTGLLTHPRQRRGFLILVSGLLIWFAVGQISFVSLRQFDWTSRYYRTTLDLLPAHTVVSCMSDTACFALLYLHEVEHVRPDIFLVPHQYKVVADQLKQRPEMHGYNYPGNPDLTLDYLSWNLGKRPVAIVDLQKVYYDALGISKGIFALHPQGYTLMLTRMDSSSIQKPSRLPLDQELSAYQFLPSDLMRQQLKAASHQHEILNQMLWQHFALQ